METLAKMREVLKHLSEEINGPHPDLGLVYIGLIEAIEKLKADLVINTEVKPNFGFSNPQISSRLDELRTLSEEYREQHSTRIAELAKEGESLFVAIQARLITALPDGLPQNMEYYRKYYGVEPMSDESLLLTVFTDVLNKMDDYLTPLFAGNGLRTNSNKLEPHLRDLHQIWEKMNEFADFVRKSVILLT
jgi:hypothetical protein